MGRLIDADDLIEYIKIWEIVLVPTKKSLLIVSTGSLRFLMWTRLLSG